MSSNIPGSKRTPSEWKVGDALEQFVEKYKNENPDKYRRSQEFGEFLLSTRFANVDTFKVDTEDKEGEEIMYKDLVNKIKLYGLTKDDLETYEIDLLKKKFGNAWEDKLVQLLDPVLEDLNTVRGTSN